MRKLPFILVLLLSCGVAHSQTLVQATTNCSFAGTNNTTATVGGSAATACPVATGWTANLTAGNRVAIFVWRKPGGGTLTGISDGGDSCVVKNQFGTKGVGYLTANGAGYFIYAGYCFNVAGATKPTFTLTFSATADTWYIFAAEVSGTKTNDGFDGAAFIPQNSVGAGTNAATTGNWTTRTNGDLIVCGVFDDANNGRTATAGTSSLTYTGMFTVDNTHTEMMFGEFGVQTTASPSTVGAFTTAGGLTDPLLGCMAFQATGAIPPNPAISLIKGSNFKTVIF